MIEGRSSAAQARGRTHTPGTYVFVAHEDIAIAIDKGDVDGIGHKAGVNRGTARKRHDKRQSAGGNRPPSQHAAQTHGKRLRHHKLGRRPANLLSARA